MKIELDNNMKIPLYRQITEQIKEMIESGVLPDGYVMPSERSLAESLGVHRNTIIRVYAELKAEDYIFSIQRKKYVVNGLDADSAEEGNKDFSWIRKMNGRYMSYAHRDKFSPFFNIKPEISFTGDDGTEAYCQEDLSSLLHELSELEDDNKFVYSHRQGDYDLRKAFAKFMQEKGVNVKPRELMVVSETMQALNLLCDVLLQAGDTVIAEEPSYPGVYRVFQGHGIKLVTVGMDKEGILCDRLERLIVKHKPKLIYVNPDFHNPTGIVMSLERRKQLLSLAHRYNIPIVEEDSLSELRFQGRPIPSLKSLDKHNSVIYLYSFCSTYASGIKLGFCIADPALIKKLSEILVWNVICVDVISQWLLTQYLQRGLYKKQLEQVRLDYEKKRDLVIEGMKPAERWGLHIWNTEGGRSLWCELAPDMDAGEICEMAKDRNVLFFPGEMFFLKASREGKRYLRLAYDKNTEEEIQKGTEILNEVLKEYWEKKHL